MLPARTTMPTVCDPSSRRPLEVRLGARLGAAELQAWVQPGAAAQVKQLGAPALPAVRVGEPLLLGQVRDEVRELAPLLVVRPGQPSSAAWANYAE